MSLEPSVDAPAESVLLNDDLAYWRDRLSGELPVLQFPGERGRSGPPSHERATRVLEVPHPLDRELAEFSERAGVTPLLTLLAAYMALLHRYSGQTDLLIGLTAAGRDVTELEEMAGDFVNPLILRVDLSGDPTVSELLRRTRETVLGAVSHGQVPFDLLVSELLPGHDSEETALFRTQVTLDSSEGSAGRTPSADLSLSIHQQAGRYLCRFNYRCDVFSEDAVERLLNHFRVLLGGMPADLDARVATLPLLTDEERRQILVEWNATAADFPSDRCIHQLVEEQAEHAPDRIAVIDERGRYTYRQINERANQLAHYLRAHGIGPGGRVGVFVDRSADLIAALLATMKSGAAYVPLDPKFPRDRLEYVLEDSVVSIVLCEESLLPLLPAVETELFVLDRAAEEIGRQPVSNPAPLAGADSVAYIIYTSGSTGKPKGVVVPHRGVVNMLWQFRTAPGLTADDVLLAVTTPSFDIHTVEFYLVLMVGATCVLAPRRVVADGSALLGYMRTYGVTAMQATPSGWKMTLNAGWSAETPVKVLVGGEALSPESAARLLERATSVWNLYGPTEISVWSNIHEVQPGDDPVPIGRPIGNMRVYILDAHGQVVPVGVTGELYIGGVGVTRGYLNRPELTNERFLPDPFSPIPDARMYRTGDLCRYRADGNIEYIGRTDFQIKIRGYRIEPGEIEAALAEHPAVADAVVLAHQESADDIRLVAYVVGTEQQEVDLADLRRRLTAALPPYMVPNTIVTMPSFPMTPNGKVDRLALPAPQPDQAAVSSSYVAPWTPTERTLAAIWSEVLGVERVGIHDNFFELGGHSLLAVTLLDRIEREYGRSIPIATLFTEATIAAVQEYLLAPEESARNSLLITVRADGTRRPFFLLHGQPLGRGFYSLKIARNLGEDQPFHVLQPHRLAGQEPPMTIEGMAADYIREVRAVQPHGPYRIGAFCLSAVIAYEMARQLQQQGEDVELLALMHTEVPRYGRTGLLRRVMEQVAGLRGGDHRQAFEWYAGLRDTRILLGRARQRPAAGRAALLSTAVRRGPGAVLKELRAEGDARIPISARVERGVRADRGMDPYFWAVAAYSFPPYEGRIALFYGDDALDDDISLGWGALASEVEIYRVPSHESVLREEVGVLSERLREALDRADGHSATDRLATSA
jgi:amino acid adenylation domain-containing protein